MSIRMLNVWFKTFKTLFIILFVRIHSAAGNFKQIYDYILYIGYTHYNIYGSTVTRHNLRAIPDVNIIVLFMVSGRDTKLKGII